MNDELKEADDAFSLYIRTKESVGGYCRCVTCGHVFPIKKIQAGHYMRRDDMPTRYDQKNVHPQCVTCNCFKQGEHKKYREVLVSKYGEKAVCELEIKASDYAGFSKTDLKDIAKIYRRKLRELENDRRKQNT